MITRKDFAELLESYHKLSKVEQDFVKSDMDHIFDIVEDFTRANKLFASPSIAIDKDFDDHSIQQTVELNMLKRENESLKLTVKELSNLLALLSQNKEEDKH